MFCVPTKTLTPSGTPKISNPTRMVAGGSGGKSLNRRLSRLVARRFSTDMRYVSRNFTQATSGSVGLAGKDFVALCGSDRVRKRVVNADLTLPIGNELFITGTGPLGPVILNVASTSG